MTDRATILILGQSNVGNHGPQRANGGPGARVFHEGSFLPAVDPLPGASGGGGSVWTRFAPKAIAAGLADEIVFVNASHGGTTVADWAPGGGFHPRLWATLRKTAETGLDITHVVWHQGERDTLMRTGETAYAERLSALIGYLREAGIDAPVFVCRATYRDGQTNAGVHAAQTAIANPRLGIFPGPDTDLLGAELRYDNTHLDADGQERFADMLVEAFSASGIRRDTLSAAG